MIIMNSIVYIKRFSTLLFQLLLVFSILLYFNVDQWIWSHTTSRQQGSWHAKSNFHHGRVRRDKSGHHSRHHSDSSSKSGFDAVCNLQIVETVPEVLRTKGYAVPTKVSHSTIHRAWLKLVELATKDFAMVSQWGIGKKGRGLDFYNHLKEAVLQKKIKVDVVHTYKFKKSSGHSPVDFQQVDPDRIRTRQPSIMGKTSPPWKYGIIHSKILVADSQHFYLGSANVGSRGLSWTKEIGMLVTNCSILATDAKKIFDVYWHIDGMKKLPQKYPSHLSTEINSQSPIKIFNKLDNSIYKIFLGSSPKSLCADGRSDDLDAILNVIKHAQKFIYIAVNEYIPMDLWKNKQPWTIIDDQIRIAVQERHVQVKFLVNSRASHKDLMLKHLKSLKQSNPDKIDIKMYKADLRGFQGSHNKLMVTEKACLIGTSNWTEDYFSTTAGVTFVIEPVNKDRSNQDLRDQMEDIFFRDYNSTLAQFIQ